MKSKHFVSRVFVYTLGLLCLAFGVAFSINSNLGVSPVNSLPYVVSLISGIDMGSCVIFIFSLYILGQILILRREFKMINLTQLIFSGLFGYFVDFAKWVLGSFSLPTYLGQLAMLAVSIFLVSLGVCLYMGVKLVNMPMEGMTHAFSESLFKKPFHSVKVWVDCASVGLAALLSLFFLGGLHGIREGTVLCAILVGTTLKPLQKLVNPLLQKFCFQPATCAKTGQPAEN